MNIIKDAKFEKQSLGFWYVAALVLIALVIHIKLATIGWRNTLCDLHSFRQTQTAISAYYTIKNGFSLNYITPILGKPWSIPMEFPLFQWIVALAVLVFKVPLDQCGRFFNLLFFYLSFIPVYFLLTRFINRKAYVLVFFCIMLACPFYIFWSRTFLIESLAVFLSLTYLAGVVHISPNRKFFLAISCIAGTLAGLTKITTFLVFVIPAFAFVLHLWLFEVHGFREFFINARSQIITIIALFIIPLLINVCWIHFADQQKLLNPLASQFITSSALRGWTFGTLNQRLQCETWMRCLIFSRFFLSCDKIWSLIIIGILFLTSRRYWKQALFCVFCYLCGPLIFTNLYYIHDYYYYANGFFLLFALGFLVLGLIENNKWIIFSICGYVVLPLLMASMYQTYYRCFYDLQKNNPTQYIEMVDAVRYFTKENDVILIYGFDWSPEIPYYSQRRAMMWPDWPMDDPRLKSAITLLENEKVAAVIMGGKYRNNQALITEYIQKFGFKPAPVYQNAVVDLYVAEGNPPE